MEKLDLIYDIVKSNSEKLDEVQKIQIVQAKDIQHHIRRSDLLEERVDQVDSEIEERHKELIKRIQILEIPWYKKVFTMSNISWFLAVVSMGLGIYSKIAGWW